MMRRDVALDFEASNLFTELSATGLHQGLLFSRVSNIIIVS